MDGKRKMLENERIVHADILDGTSMLVTFSNGSAARIGLDDVKRLAMSVASEITTEEADEESLP